MNIRRLEVALGLRMNDYATLDVGAKNIQAKMAAAASILIAPNPTMPVLLQQVTEYSLAHLAVITTRAKGTTEARAVKRDTLWSSLQSERSYVQILCDSAPENAANYAALAGMRIVLPGMAHRDILVAKLTTVPGEVSLKAAASLLVAPGGGKAKARMYLWRFSVDGGKSFVNVDPTPLAHTLVQGLPLGTIVGFQVAVKDSAGMSDWSQTVALLVH